MGCLGAFMSTDTPVGSCLPLYFNLFTWVLKKITNNVEKYIYNLVFSEVFFSLVKLLNISLELFLQ